MELVIMRGLPGSGKSTLAKSLGGLVLSADDYFTDRRGRYNYDAGRISSAHAWNLRRVIGAMKSSTPRIIVDNTNVRAFHAAPYVRAAIQCGYSVRFLEPNTPWRYSPEECAKKTKHAVPLERIRSMAEQCERDITVENCLAACSRAG